MPSVRLLLPRDLVNDFPGRQKGVLQKHRHSHGPHTAWNWGDKAGRLPNSWWRKQKGVFTFSFFWELHIFKYAEITWGVWKFLRVFFLRIIDCFEQRQTGSGQEHSTDRKEGETFRRRGGSKARKVLIGYSLKPPWLWLLVLRFQFCKLEAFTGLDFSLLT